MADKSKKGDHARARKVVHGDYRDESKDEGVVVGIPGKGKEYYDILNPYDQTKPFHGHVDDATVIPDHQLSPSEKSFKQKVWDMLTGKS